MALEMGTVREKSTAWKESTGQLGGGGVGRRGGGDEGSWSRVSLNSGLGLHPGGTCALLRWESHGIVKSQNHLQKIGKAHGVQLFPSPAKATTNLCSQVPHPRVC